MSDKLYELAIEELAQILGRDPTDVEIQDYIDQVESQWENNSTSYLEDLASGHYNTD